MSLRHLALLFTLTLAASPALALDAEELVAKNLEARGGRERLAAVTSVHTQGTVRLGGSLEARTEAWGLVPGAIRTELSLQGMTAIQAWDGKEAWTVQPFRGRKDPQKISADDAKGLVEAADLVGPLVDYARKGNTVEYLGTEDVEGTDAHKLRVTLKNGDVQYRYLDPDHFLEIRVVSHRMVRGQEEVQTVDLGEYEKVDGLYFPFELGRTHLEKMELNVLVDSNIFGFPGGGR
jgi:hypothetical protein